MPLLAISSTASLPNLKELWEQIYDTTTKQHSTINHHYPAIVVDVSKDLLATEGLHYDCLMSTDLFAETKHAVQHRLQALLRDARNLKDKELQQLQDTVVPRVHALENELAAARAETQALREQLASAEEANQRLETQTRQLRQKLECYEASEWEDLEAHMVAVLHDAHTNSRVKSSMHSTCTQASTHTTQDFTKASSSAHSPQLSHQNGVVL
jgi:regulator of replication initiation timing